jgi:hypothetical protein
VIVFHREPCKFEYSKALVLPDKNFHNRCRYQIFLLSIGRQSPFLPVFKICLEPNQKVSCDFAIRSPTTPAPKFNWPTDSFNSSEAGVARLALPGTVYNSDQTNGRMGCRAFGRSRPFDGCGDSIPGAIPKLKGYSARI